MEMCGNYGVNRSGECVSINLLIVQFEEKKVMETHEF